MVAVEQSGALPRPFEGVQAGALGHDVLAEQQQIEGEIQERLGQLGLQAAAEGGLSGTRRAVEQNDLAGRRGHDRRITGPCGGLDQQAPIPGKQTLSCRHFKSKTGAYMDHKQQEKQFRWALVRTAWALGLALGLSSLGSWWAGRRLRRVQPRRQRRLQPPGRTVRHRAAAARQGPQRRAAGHLAGRGQPGRRADRLQVSAGAARSAGQRLRQGVACPARALHPLRRLRGRQGPGRRRVRRFLALRSARQVLPADLRLGGTQLARPERPGPAGTARHHHSRTAARAGRRHPLDSGRARVSGRRQRRKESGSTRSAGSGTTPGRARWPLTGPWAAKVRAFSSTPTRATGPARWSARKSCRAAPET